MSILTSVKAGKYKEIEEFYNTHFKNKYLMGRSSCEIYTFNNIYVLKITCDAAFNVCIDANILPCNIHFNENLKGRIILKNFKTEKDFKKIYFLLEHNKNLEFIFMNCVFPGKYKKYKPKENKMANQ